MDFLAFLWMILTSLVDAMRTVWVLLRDLVAANFLVTWWAFWLIVTVVGVRAIRRHYRR